MRGAAITAASSIGIEGSSLAQGLIVARGCSARRTIGLYGIVSMTVLTS